MSWLKINCMGAFYGGILEFLQFQPKLGPKDAFSNFNGYIWCFGVSNGFSSSLGGNRGIPWAIGPFLIILRTCGRVFWSIPSVWRKYFHVIWVYLSPKTWISPILTVKKKQKKTKVKKIFFYALKFLGCKVHVRTKNKLYGGILKSLQFQPKWGPKDAFSKFNGYIWYFGPILA